MCCPEPHSSAWWLRLESMLLPQHLLLTELPECWAQPGWGRLWLRKGQAVRPVFWNTIARGGGPDGEPQKSRPSSVELLRGTRDVRGCECECEKQGPAGFVLGRGVRCVNVHRAGRIVQSAYAFCC